MPDTISEEDLYRSLRNLKHEVAKKLRSFLKNTGLYKHSEFGGPVEPIPNAVYAFDKLRTNILNKLKEHIEIAARTGDNFTNLQKIETFWGFIFPKDKYDVDLQDVGKSDLGTFDKILESVINRTNGKSQEEKINILIDLANSFE